MTITNADLDTAREWIAQARRLCVSTGAGMSAESGVPTFRDALGGMWARFDPQQLATEAGYRADPQLVWDWYASRREGVAQAQPNGGHVALAEWQRRHPGRMTLITQNVDDLHQRAGSDDVVCLHGGLFVDRWLDPCPRWKGGQPPCDTSTATPGRPPHCETCGNRVRPGVVWFGEALPGQALQAAEDAANDCDVMLVVGTSGAVYPAAGLPLLARQAGAKVVVLNPQPSELDDTAHLVLRDTAAHGLPLLLT
ncbi:SIR2 family NAD-dependent protein deacylase [Caldimonas brevitalea]|uniref:NAD-dependent protein deacylase n=1 Tax=Caldimonas brevitalea TaxID=413882 RepID=A0A0G3BSR8_9BURK|nr:NAD-dependent deacylase [Caldimonas brevitalea]AKJ29590.1 NAD-dependent protein deacylase [Caldimonas brevitalea]